MENSFAIETQNLFYKFNKYQTVFNNVNLQVPTGSIFGFLGPNGAGKTTTMKMLTGAIPSNDDNIFILGKTLKKNIPNLFHQLGTLIETPSFYLHLSGYNNLKIICTLKQIDYKNINPALEKVGLLQAAHKKASQYSLGMKQRLGIAIALLNNPTLLMLDEPVNGLDPAGMIEVRELLKTLNKEFGTTVFISSHLLHEIENTCTHISIIQKGVLKYQDTLHNLYEQQNNKNQVHFVVSNAKNAVEILQQKTIKALAINTQNISVDITTMDDAANINKILVDNNIAVYGINKNLALEDWFMQMTS